MPDTTVPRIAWFTPLRPVESGISLYSEELLAAVGRDWPIDIFVDGYSPSPFEPFGQLRVISAREFERRDKRESYACVVYQLGNSPAHAYMYDVALRRPGVVVLHDTVLHHLRLSMIGGRGGAARYIEAMRRQYGERGETTAAKVLQGRLPHALFEFPLSEDVIASARHVVVHSAFSRDQVRSWVPNAEVSVIPMGIRLPPPIEKSQARAALQLPQDSFVLGSITTVNPYKRLDVVLRALSRLRRDHRIRMLIAGNVSPHVPLKRWIGLYQLEGVVEQLGFVDDSTARLVAASADALVNLRYPTAGETSASLLRLMAAARPVLVSETGSFSEIPDHVVAKVPVDVLEEETIEALLGSLIAVPDLASELGANARSYVERHHMINDMVAGYRRMLHDGVGIDLPEPLTTDINEKIELDLTSRQSPIDPLSDAVGIALVELGMGGNDGLQLSVATAMAEMGLAPDKM